jgi:hypothetical protein
VVFKIISVGSIPATLALMKLRFVRSTINNQK